MILKSFSKINLTLGVNSKVKRKHFHQIESVFCLTNLYDEIAIKKIKKRNDVIKIKGKFARQINKKNNSGKVIIEYKSLDQFDLISKKLRK